MTPNFTPRAMQTLALARREANRFNHNYVGTDHLLLGLIRLGQGVAVNVLQKMGIDLGTVRTEVEKQIDSGPGTKMAGKTPYTPRLKKVLALAAKEAKSLNHSCVGTEHILLGLLREGEGAAARVLKNLEVEIERTRNEILKELDPNFTPKAHPDAPQIIRAIIPTPRAIQIWALAQKEADRLHHHDVGPEHLLLALITLGEGGAVNALRKLGLDLETIRMEVEKQAGGGREAEAADHAPFAPRLEKAVAFAVKEAKSTNCPRVCTEHILLGLLREGKGVAVRALENLGVDIERARNEIRKDLKPAGGEIGQQEGTDRALSALALSRKEADRFNHNYVGTEHLLLGLTKLGESIAASALQKMGFDLETIRIEVEKQMVRGPDAEAVGTIPYTPSSRKVLLLAGKEAKLLNQARISTGHILLGLLCEDEGLAARTLKNLGVEMEPTRNAVLAEIDPDSLPRGESEPKEDPGGEGDKTSRP